MTQQLPYLALAAAALAWILYRQLSVRPVRENRPYLLMLVLGVVGIGQIAAVAGHAAIPAAAYLAMGAGLVSAAAVGWWRGSLIRVWRDGGTLLRQGNWTTVALWIAGLAIHLGLDQVGVFLAPAAERAGAQALGTTSIMLYLSIALAAQRFGTLSRARAAAPAATAALTSAAQPAARIHH
ncbi:hypothetical protein QO003_003799 [Arthrobacter silviterrae]|uniref:DUF1453 domain-containing protein n=1 Tax=Arthrobacter silviterrae TaxID=2026658 RepID=A0ABX0DCA5_9MICC|nr:MULTISPECIES: hypothetical protein [Arthrobacter]MCU6482185.1 hypothetical protein [Arthrobacter sp. A2-55]MDQ0279496.1 hypothetical protein [Arthrobacter silviterrae]NGN82025.1 hypothetical protein [Arthrobacter silviterrae]